MIVYFCSYGGAEKKFIQRCKKYHLKYKKILEEIPLKGLDAPDIAYQIYLPDFEKLLGEDIDNFFIDRSTI